MLSSISAGLRKTLSPENRRRLRALIDPAFAFVGSINGSRKPVRTVALTFDDGPDPVVTPRLLDLLRDRRARATFFVLTEKAEAHPKLMKRIVDEGHEAALHFDRHDRLTSMPIGQAKSRLVAARESLEQLAGPVRYFRPPFGAQSLGTYLMARGEGLEVVSWSHYAEDWVEQPAAMAADRALRGLSGGDILLLHDGLEKPAGEELPTFDRVEMVKLVIDGLEARGLTAGTVGELVEAGPPRRTAWFRA